MHTLATYIRLSVKRWWMSNPSMLSAALSYYALFSIAPFFLLALAVAGVFINTSTAEHTLFLDIQRLAGPQAAEFLRSMLAGAIDFGSGLAAAVSISIILVVSVSMFSHIKASLDMIRGDAYVWRGVGYLLKSRLYLFLMIFIFGILLVVSASASAFFSLASKTELLRIMPVPGLWSLVASELSLILVIIMLVCMYRYLPTRRVSWLSAWVGAVLASLLLMIGRYGIISYLRVMSFEDGYQAATAAVIIMIWVYYSAQIFFFGGAWAMTLDDYSKHEHQ